MKSLLGMALFALAAIGPALAAPSPALADASCDALAAVLAKTASVPVRAHTTVTSPAGSFEYETLDIPAMHYSRSLAGGTWSKWKSDPRDPKATRERLANQFAGGEYSCWSAGSEALNGAPADIFANRRVIGTVASATRTWISQASGLPLKSELTTARGSREETVFDYSDVQTPPD